MRISPHFLAVFVGLLSACDQSRGIRPGDTQIIAQWLAEDSIVEKTTTARALDELSTAYQRVTLETLIGRSCGRICFFDGSAIGGGAYNLYLYTQDVGGAVSLLVNLEKSGRLPSGLRIGVAKYSDPEHKNWTYQPAWPSTLRYFDVAYPPPTEAR